MRAARAGAASRPARAALVGARTARDARRHTTRVGHRASDACLGGGGALRARTTRWARQASGRVCVAVRCRVASSRALRWRDGARRAEAARRALDAAALALIALVRAGSARCARWCARARRGAAGSARHWCSRAERARVANGAGVAAALRHQPSRIAKGPLTAWLGDRRACWTVAAKRARLAFHASLFVLVLAGGACSARCGVGGGAERARGAVLRRGRANCAGGSGRAVLAI